MKEVLKLYGFTETTDSNVFEKGLFSALVKATGSVIITESNKTGKVVETAVYNSYGDLKRYLKDSHNG
jgi:hypothetical protein